MTDPLFPARDRPTRTTILGLRRSEWAIGATAVGMNVLVNGVLPARLHVPASLAAAGAVTGLAVRAGASVEEQGLDLRQAPKGAAFGIAAAVPIACALGAGLLFERSRGFYRERRITDATALRAAHELWVRIPLGTALPEELIFRGAVLGLLTRYHHPLVATAISSVLFGLWHIAPTIDRIEAEADHPAGRQPASTAARVTTAVAVTTTAGFALAWLRYKSGSVVAPWIAHLAANTAGFAAGWLAARLMRATSDDAEGQQPSMN